MSNSKDAAGVTLDADMLAFLRQEQDRRAILDCLHRYTRGIDRNDRDLMISAYHEDALDQHGVAEGLPGPFCDWAIGWHRDAQTRHQHIITNHSFDFDGDTVHVESYYIFWGDNRQGPPSLCFGRYIDRFEKRKGRWGIAHRVCVNELVGEITKPDLPTQWADALGVTGPIARDGSDVSYQRPLTNGNVAKPN